MKKSINQRKETTVFLAWLLLLMIIGVTGCGWQWLNQHQNKSVINTTQTDNFIAREQKSTSISAQISQGDKNLITQDITPEKQAAAKAITTYDATKAIVAGLSNNPSREGIQKTLSQSKFAFEGASGTVKFLASGDRNQEVQLVQVQPGKRSSFGYDFMPLKQTAIDH